jgi:hypothetical protein
MTSNQRRKAPSSGAATDRSPWRATLLASLLIVTAGGAWLLFGRGPNFAAEAEVLQQQLLAEDIPPRQRREMLATLMRHVDKLDTAAQQKLVTNVRQQWREIQQQDMDAYFAATGPERQAALDRGLDRLMLIADLSTAFSPGGMRVRQPRPKPPADGTAKDSRPPRPPARDAATVAAERSAREAYFAALEKRARERGLKVPPLGRRPKTNRI